MLEKEVLTNLYLIENLTRDQIAEKLGVKLRTVKTWLSKYGIKKSEELKRKHYYYNHEKGMVFWNDGVNETCAKECPGPNWVRGRKPGWYELQAERNKHHIITEDGRAKLRENGARRRGTTLSEESKQKISNFWKTHVHPLKNKSRPEDVRIKISKKLIGHEQIAPSREKVETISVEKALSYLKRNNTIDLNKIYKDLNIRDNQYSRELVFKHFDNLGIKYKKYTSTSLKESEWASFIKSIYSGEVIENYKRALGTYEIDIYIPEYNIGLEYNGIYWHKTPYIKENGQYIVTGPKAPDYHQKKSLLAREKGLHLIHIWEDRLKDFVFKAALEKYLRALLNKTNNKEVYAKDCVLKEVSADEYKIFCDTYHLEAYKKASIRFGLYYKDELLQCVAFNKIDEDTYEWVRNCKNQLDMTIIGGDAKLFNYFIKVYNPKTVIYYNDLTLFNTVDYFELGFNKTEVIPPDKFYITKSRALDRTAATLENDIEYMEKVINGELVCCYGSGSLKFIWTSDYGA